MSQARSRDHALAKVGHGKSNASMTRMHGRLDMHGIPCGCNKAQGCLPSDTSMGAMHKTCACGLRCGIDDIAAMP